MAPPLVVRHGVFGQTCRDAAKVGRACSSNGKYRLATANTGSLALPRGWEQIGQMRLVGSRLQMQAKKG
jgi:hypothetical protein